MHLVPFKKVSVQQVSNLINALSFYCLVRLQVPKCFVSVQFFWASPKFWLHLVPHQNLLCRHKNRFYWMQIIFLSGTKYLWLPQYVNKFLVWHKKFGLAQNILGPVKGQGIRRPQTFGETGRFFTIFVIFIENQNLPRPSAGSKIFWASQTCCARPKDDFHLVNTVFVQTQNVLERH